jgi:hypothetical protein
MIKDIFKTLFTAKAEPALKAVHNSGIRHTVLDFTGLSRSHSLLMADYAQRLDGARKAGVPHIALCAEEHETAMQASMPRTLLQVNLDFNRRAGINRKPAVFLERSRSALEDTTAYRDVSGEECFYAQDYLGTLAAADRMQGNRCELLKGICFYVSDLAPVTRQHLFYSLYQAVKQDGISVHFTDTAKEQKQVGDDIITEIQPAWDAMTKATCARLYPRESNINTKSPAGMHIRNDLGVSILAGNLSKAGNIVQMGAHHAAGCKSENRPYAQSWLGLMAGKSELSGAHVTLYMPFDGYTGDCLPTETLRALKARQGKYRAGPRYDLVLLKGMDRDRFKAGQTSYGAEEDFLTALYRHSSWNGSALPGQPWYDKDRADVEFDKHFEVLKAQVKPRAQNGLELRRYG